MVSLPAVTALGVGSILIYGGLTGKSTFAVTRQIMLGGSPANAATTNALNTAIPPGGPEIGTPNVPQGTDNIVNSIVSTFKAHGASLAQIAGALGNIQVESGFSPTSSNSREGAIGLCQWEKGRRTNLQNFARSRGTTETDAATQIDFIWHELQGSEIAAYGAWKVTTSPSAAASVWDAMYERSDGSARQTRIKYAEQWYAVIK